MAALGILVSISIFLFLKIHISFRLALRLNPIAVGMLWTLGWKLSGISTCSSTLPACTCRLPIWKFLIPSTFQEVIIAIIRNAVMCIQDLGAMSHGFAQQI